MEGLDFAIATIKMGAGHYIQGHFVSAEVSNGRTLVTICLEGKRFRGEVIGNVPNECGKYRAHTSAAISSG